jgi:hypothetical protein
MEMMLGKEDGRYYRTESFCHFKGIAKLLFPFG